MWGILPTRGLEAGRPCGVGSAREAPSEMKACVIEPSKGGQLGPAGHGATIKALSVRQPFAWLIVHGFKPVEYRSWPTSYRGPLAIHAGGRVLSRSEFDEVEADFGLSIPRDELVRSAIVGLVELVDCYPEEDGFGFVLMDFRPIKPVPMPGQLGLFNVKLPQ
jgi:hypothetical protein